MDILCFSSSDWHGKWGSRQQVMAQLARRGYRVLFVERQVGPEHLLRYSDSRRRKWVRWREGVLQSTGNLWIVSLPLLIPGRYYSEGIARLNQKLTAFFTRPYLEKLGIEHPVLWLYRPEHGGLIGAFNESLSVYHCIDEYAAGTRGRKRRVITNLEKEILRKADIVLTNSLLTYSEKRTYNAHTFRVPSGVDIENFARAYAPDTPVHPKIADISHPIAGYVGNINKKLDIALLTVVAKLLPDWHFVFVGQADVMTAGLQALQQCANVHLLGCFPFEEMPSLVKKMDVCLLPYADIEYARYRSPLKLYEYLAAGKPIVSTDHPEVREFADWARIAKRPREFADAIEKTYREDTPTARRNRISLSKKHSWGCRVEEIERILYSTLSQKSSL